MHPFQSFTVMIIAMMTGGNAISVKDGTKTVVTVTTIKKNNPTRHYEPDRVVPMARDSVKLRCVGQPTG
jgi:hypothetical protein